jgi:hypothetical protein
MSLTQAAICVLKGQVIAIETKPDTNNPPSRQFGDNRSNRWLRPLINNQWIVDRDSATGRVNYRRLDKRGLPCIRLITGSIGRVGSDQLIGRRQSLRRQWIGRYNQAAIAIGSSRVRSYMWKHKNNARDERQHNRHTDTNQYQR